MGGSLHPAVLDACLQVMLAAVPEAALGGDPYVPLGWEALSCAARRHAGWCARRCCAAAWARRRRRICGCAMRRARCSPRCGVCC